MTRAPVTVITATIPGREHLLARCVESVNRQTIKPQEHLIMSQDLDDGLPGQVHCAIMQNRLMKTVDTRWIMRLADDDYLLPNHIEMMMRGVEKFDYAHVIYSWDESGHIPPVNCNNWNVTEIKKALLESNWIDGSGAFIKTRNLRMLRGWPDLWVDDHFISYNGDQLAPFEDWALWQMFNLTGALFRCVPVYTWVAGQDAPHRISTGDIRGKLRPVGLGNS